MIGEATLRELLPSTLQGVDLADEIPGFGARTQGKVRDLYTLGDKIVMIASDRISAFDHVLGLIPCKGQALTQLAAWWFENVRDIVPSAFIETPDPNVTVSTLCRTLPVEVVVRGYITGVTSTSLWQRYALGERHIYGIDFPEGLHKNDPLPAPIITPTTKAEQGAHDERITEAEIVAQGLTTAAQWEEIRTAAIALFLRGQEIARRGGLILVDTKYEFGLLPDGRVAVIDEIHTPDSSRFWDAATLEDRAAAGLEPENFDKEFLRLQFAARGFRGEGTPPPIDPEFAVQVALRYIGAYERITGQQFVPAAQPAQARIVAALRAWSARQSIESPAR